ncbi:MAG: transcription-repair coupling factor [Tissierellia bacterium]|nr:transcription-repair coupling factor [Tissierellia bacterium]
MNYIIDQLKNLSEYVDMLDQLKAGNASIYLYGLIRESMPHFIYALNHDLEKSIFVVVEDELRAKAMYDSLSGLPIDRICYYPKSEISFHDIKPLESSSDLARIEVMNRLVRGEKLIVIASVEALHKKISTPIYFKNLTLHIDATDEVDIADLANRLMLLQYERVSTVESKGQYAIRGGIIDIYPIDRDTPVRVELFDTEIDSIRTFGVSDQRSIEHIDGFDITPAREFLINQKDKNSILAGLDGDIEEMQGKFLYGVDKELLAEKYNKIREYIANDILLSNPDLVMPYIKQGSYAGILDYLDRDAVILFEDLAKIYDRMTRTEESFRSDFAYQLEKGEVFSSHQQMVYDFAQILHSAKGFSTINVTQLRVRTRLLNPDHSYPITTIETQTYHRNFSLMAEKLREYMLSGHKIILFAQSEERMLSLKDALALEEIPVLTGTDLNQPLKSGQVMISPYSMSRGFEYRNLKLVVITHNEIYGTTGKAASRAPKKRKTTKDLINYSDLTIGDFVVHENHGIGRYQGLEQIDVGGIVKDYLLLEYRGADRLYIPTDQMNLIQKYIGAEAKLPKLNKLGGMEWNRTKQKAKKALDEIADDLVELYARRSQDVGYAFSKDSHWQREFEDSFIYEETYAQLRCIDEIKRDMESDKPMERLLCGDVGYGKTEVALRAAFKAIMDGKQVAFLVPTTILAQQHYNTAVERFRNFPMKVEMISRFRSPARQKVILEEARKGYVDLLIGTHRILSKDLQFKDIGLLIIDEEQRFGVRHKDKLKQLRKNIDVLFLSATPIPRTLQMGLVGIKDMSLLDEAPEERYPTNTYVLEYDAGIVREAILKEMERGGQVYFVYNRVRDIEEMSYRLRELIPEARIVIGHGQMTERLLEKVMMDFTDGEYDILLSTSIIETGLDIQNVNTMIVYNADYMGLSQLYQLKGRIGRGERSSYAYFTYEKGKTLTEVSEKRLKAIRDFTEFGSGFKIAMRDLELRGAGNMLGESQSGHIEAIGYDLYVKMLETAIQQAKGITEPERTTEVTIELGIDSYIPSDYIHDSTDKIDIYKRIANMETKAEMDDMIDELIDRYGDIPASVLNIMYLSLVKTLAVQLGFSKLYETQQHLVAEYEEQSLFSPKVLFQLSDLMEGQLELSLVNPPSLKIPVGTGSLTKLFQLLANLREFVQEEKNSALPEQGH